MKNLLLNIENLQISFGDEPSVVDNISFNIWEGETVAIVGESGSGKTTLGRAILKAVPITNGTITYDDGENRFDIA